MFSDSMIVSSLRLVWTRLTLSKVTLAYFLFILLHCFVQVGLQAGAFTINNNADRSLKNVMRAAGLVPPAGISVSNGSVQSTQAEAPSTSIVATSSVGSLATSLPVNAAAPSTESLQSTVSMGTPTATSQPSSRSVQTSASTLSTQSSAIESSTSETDSLGPPTALALKVASAVGSSPVPANAPTPVIVTVVRQVTVTQERIVAALPSKAPNSFEQYINTPKSYSRNSKSNYRGIDERRDRVLGQVIARKLGIQQVNIESNGSVLSVTLTGVSNQTFLPDHTLLQTGVPRNQTLNVDLDCVKMLNYPLSRLAQAGREDVVFLGFNVWVLGVSLTAILNESMPHIIAAIATHMFITGWSGFQIWQTADFRAEFLRKTRDTSCYGVNLLPAYWEQRAILEIIQLILNVVALVASLLLSWKLIKQFGWQTFKRVGASLSVHTSYRFVLAFSVALQLGVFFILTSTALFVEQVSFGPVRNLTSHAPAFQAISVTTVVLLIPWIICGWFGVRREGPILTTVFIVGNVAVLLSYAALFGSHSFRALFHSWPFFTIIYAMGFALSIVTLVLSSMCRLRFGKNGKALSHYLKHQEAKSSEKRRDFGADLEEGDGPTDVLPSTSRPHTTAVTSRSPKVFLSSFRGPSRKTSQDDVVRFPDTSVLAGAKPIVWRNEGDRNWTETHAAVESFRTLPTMDYVPPRPLYAQQGYSAEGFPSQAEVHGVQHSLPWPQVHEETRLPAQQRGRAPTSSRRHQELMDHVSSPRQIILAEHPGDNGNFYFVE